MTMIDIREPKFVEGQPVKAAVDLVNDGSYPDAAPEQLLAATGDAGEVVQVGMHTETNTPIYMVEFANRRVVGCLEEELAPV